ncbi:MAG TPA: hypothetical protein VJP81_08420 [Candidatus Dormibacteraeota bacterium]|nr:hypothetical protein [Candidatus Dormibacteraeota bacterium]
MDRRLTYIVASFLIAIAFFVLHQLFAAAWSNKCDPGNMQFFLMKNDPALSFSPHGSLFTWENDGPDNSWLCSDASLSVSYVGPNIGSMFDAARANMSANGWVGGDIFLKDQDFAVYEKDKGGVRLNAIVRKQLFWVEVDVNAPGLHPGEYGFG